MYVIRRVAKTQPGKAWNVASYLAKICGAYEEKGRSKAQIFVGHGLPGDQHVAYAEWTQERIEPNSAAGIPEAVLELHKAMMEMVTDYTIEFYQLVTPEELKVRGGRQPGFAPD
ncbi:MAG: hypothetical protein J4N83_06465 [Chloroflexi bacterium]|nr:hypothetical protein [Chloroflexota bacterium]